MKPVFGTLSVAQAANLLGELLSSLPVLRIQGEVSGFNIARSSFVFFSLKDSTGEASLSCFAMVHALSFPLEDGMEIIITGTAGLYQKNGNLRITVRQVEVVGAGSLRRAFALLTSKLEKEGFFAEGRKRPLPAIPKRVNIISSEGAAGFGDFMKIAYARLPGVQYRLYNVTVQGSTAEAEIVQAFTKANQEAWGEVIVLVRGGGSLDDMATFSSEPVARAIAASRLPVLTGIGHERDTSIADLVADKQAATPTHAAQLLLPLASEILTEVQAKFFYISVQIRSLLTLPKSRCAVLVSLANSRVRSEVIRLHLEVAGRLKTIYALSPEAILKRGFTLTYSEGKVIHSIAEASGLQSFVTQFHDGEINTVYREL